VNSRAFDTARRQRTIRPFVDAPLGASLLRASGRPRLAFLLLVASEIVRFTRRSLPFGPSSDLLE
jgi:hypothetical protein